MYHTKALVGIDVMKMMLKILKKYINDLSDEEIQKYYKIVNKHDKTIGKLLK